MPTARRRNDVYVDLPAASFRERERGGRRLEAAGQSVFRLDVATEEEKERLKGRGVHQILCSP